MVWSGLVWSEINACKIKTKILNLTLDKCIRFTVISVQVAGNII